MLSLLDIGASLADTRRALGLTQHELGERVGVSQQQIARWEASRYRGASLERVSAVAEALGVGQPAELVAEESARYWTRPTGLAGILDHAARVALREICARDGISRLSVFGSAIHEGLRPDSDLDVLVEFEPGATPGFGFVDIADELSDLFGRHVDLHTPASLSRYLRDDVMSEAEVLCAR